MDKKDFVHLHLHSEYSLLDGANRIDDIPKRVKELGMSAVAITDHGVMFGAVDFYKACKKEGIKPIIGSEVYVAPRSRLDKDPTLDKDRYHLVLLVKNEEGYKNLTHLLSIASTEGFYYKPRIDREVLKEYSKGLIALSACMAGELPRALEAGDDKKAEEIALWYKEVFGDDYYIELQSNGLREQLVINSKLVMLANRLNIPVVATNDSHYTYPEDARYHDVLLCIQTGKRLSDPDRMKFETDELYIKSPEEMYESFGSIPEAIENTIKIAEKCNFDFEFGNTKLPNYEIPGVEDHTKYFTELCYKGLEKKYGKITDELEERIEREIEVISNMGFVDYFLIVWDFIKYAKQNQIPVGPGRGSGAGSLAAYALDITDIDPMKYDLLFERFLNPERISMPDFDIDFCNERRGEVLDYVADKYGRDHVAQIITFGTLAARQVIRDVGRVLDIPLAKVDKIAKLIPTSPGANIDKTLKEVKDFKALYDSEPEAKNIIDIAKRFEGMPRNISTHACGVVITDKPVEEYVPLYLNDENIITQYPMNILESLGLLKMDFLGLRTLTVIKDAIKIIEKVRGETPKFDPKMSDPNVYKLWQEGDTLTVFQFESQGMIKFMKNLKPDRFEDIIAGVSLYRPGPMDQIPRYIKGKRNKEDIEYTHPALEPILNVTYGCMVYQEQVMQIARQLAGYSLGRADILRRAMGKKQLDIMKKEREIFIHGETDEKGNVILTGCVRNGVDAKSADKIFDEMEEFAKYAFNKSHAAAYSVLSYKTAHLKAYYPAEMLAATMNSYIGNLDRIPMYIEDAKKHNIEVLVPHVNKSFEKFAVDKKTGNIIFGLGSIKNIGMNAAESIVDERKVNGEYTSFDDFIKRTIDKGINKKVIESLIKVGALDGLGQTRATLLASFVDIIDYETNKDKNVMEGQITMFDITGQQVKPDLYIIQPEMSKRQMLAYENEMIGIYISGHPLERISKYLEKMSNIDSRAKIKIMDGETNKYKDKQSIIYTAMVDKVKIRYSKKNNMIILLDVLDYYGEFKVMLFEPLYRRIKDLLVEDNVVGIIGALSIKEDDEPIIIARDIKQVKINGVPISEMVTF